MRINCTGERGPAEYRRRSTGSTADDDVLRCRAFQVHGVHHGIADQ